MIRGKAGPISRALTTAAFWQLNPQRTGIYSWGRIAAYSTFVPGKVPCALGLRPTVWPGTMFMRWPTMGVQISGPEVPLAGLAVWTNTPVASNGFTRARGSKVHRSPALQWTSTVRSGQAPNVDRSDFGVRFG